MKRYAVAALVLGALACSDSNAPVHKPGSFGILPALDTVMAGISVTFVAEREDSTVDAWQVSDSSVAHIDAHERYWARVKTLAAGRVTITALRQGDSGQATLVILPVPPPVPFAILPALDTVIVGEMVTFVTSHDSAWTIDAWSLSDSALARFDGAVYYQARVVTRAAGTVTITGTHQGDTARATLVVRDPLPGEWESIDLGLVDSAGSAAATAIADDGTIIGYLASSPQIAIDAAPKYWRGFIYKDGVMRKLPSRGGIDIPEVIGPLGKIAGKTRGNPNEGVSVWDSPDALPRQLALETNEQGDVVGVNERGDVLFTAATQTADYAPPSRAVLWRDGVSVDLGSLGDSTVRPWTIANAWNAKGQIVGRSHVRNRETVTGALNWNGRREEFHPFLWENGVMRDLGVVAPSPCLPGGTGTDCSWGEALDINNNGIVVGKVNGPDTWSARAFIWENGVMRDLGVDPGRSTSAIAINDRGQVLGISQTYGVFLWEDGHIQSTGLRYATALGPNGEVIGGTLCARTRGFCSSVWQAGQLTNLGEGQAVAVNGNGEIVGRSGSRAMLWRKKR